MTNCYEYELVINYSVHVHVGFLRDDSDPDKNTESVRVDVVPITAAGGGRVKPALDTALILLGTAAEGKASPVGLVSLIYKCFYFEFAFTFSG